MTDLYDNIPDDLDDNPTTASLRKLIGDALYQHLAADFGGRKIYIPEVIGEHHPIAVCVGLDAAQKISHVYGRMEIDISPEAGLRVKIARLYKGGTPKSQIGFIVGVSRRHVYRVLADLADLDESNQMHLPL
ncbi:helix-turn-helix domain-containing protein [Micavibrio aeruginosavorus]|uniref:helix-turn-helix domain-containing protein n=1 Tax=Micavibrio aeruginosavorus TaxID=349221 RepID=UPI003F4A9F53